MNPLMNLKHASLAVIASLAASAALAQAPASPSAQSAQNAPGFIQRNINQQERIEQGLQSGQLNTREAARLEREQSAIERREANALRDGQLTAQERARINAAQNRASRDIAREKHDAQFGNPYSVSSQRMQTDVQRNVNQQSRIQQGMKSGELTRPEAARLEAGQSRVTAAEARAGHDGHVGVAEQADLRWRENHQSRRIYKEKHDAQIK